MDAGAVSRNGFHFFKKRKAFEMSIPFTVTPIKTPKKSQLFHVADIFGTLMNHFVSRIDTVGDASFEPQVNIEAFGI